METTTTLEKPSVTQKPAEAKSLKTREVLLVYPSAQGEDFPEIPLPLLYIAWAIKQKGFNPTILDMRLQDYTLIDPSKYLCVGITAMTGPMIKEGIKFCKYVRELSPKTPLIWGGVHASILPEQTLKSTYCDYVVKGEGEVIFQELCDALFYDKGVYHIQGLGHKTGGKETMNPGQTFMNMNELSIKLPYDLVDMEKYTKHSFPVHTSRGCPYRCSFCYNLAFNERKWRRKDAKMVVDEIEYVIKEFGVTNISFTWEDEFFIDKKRVKEICEEIVARDVKFTWDAFCRFNNFVRFDKEYIELLERSGCSSISFGGESGSQRILDDIIVKDIKVADMLKTAEMLKGTNIRMIVSFMSGVPTETEEDMQETYDIMDRLYEINPNLYLNGLFLYSPYPGTPLFDRICKEFGYKMPDSLEKWGEFKVYRNTDGIEWHPKKYLNKFKNISILTRFPFYTKSFKLSDVQNVVAGGRFARFPYNIVYYIYTQMARWRWKHRRFEFPIEWVLLEKVMVAMRGFV